MLFSFLPSIEKLEYGSLERRHSRLQDMATPLLSVLTSATRAVRRSLLLLGSASDDYETQHLSVTSRQAQHPQLPGPYYYNGRHPSAPHTLYCCYRNPVVALSCPYSSLLSVRKSYSKLTIFPGQNFKFTLQSVSSCRRGGVVTPLPITGRCNFAM